jgi:hypothetical protein
MKWIAAAFLFAALVAVVVVAALRWASDVPGVSFSGVPPALAPDEARLAARMRSHVEAIAARERNVPDNPEHLEAAARYIERQLIGMGYEIESQNYDAAGHTVRNISVRLGTDAPGKPAIVI